MRRNRFVETPLVLLLGLLTFLAGCQPASIGGEAEDQPPPWTWSEDEIRQAVNPIRAGRSLQPEQWPGGARVAVLLSFDVDNETVWLRNSDTSIGGLSQGEYGGRTALPRVVSLLDSHRIPASFFIPAVSLMLNPGMAEVIKESGRHEFAVHGWIHEHNTQITGEEERQLLQKAVAKLTELTGERPVGYRAPSWNSSPNTLQIIQELGFLYDSSLMADDRPYEILADNCPSGMVELPVDWILDDAPLMNPLGGRYSPPREVLQVYIDEFDKAYEEGTMFLLTLHPHYIGHRSRIVVLEELIEHIRSKPDVWFATHKEVAELVKPGSLSE